MIAEPIVRKHIPEAWDDVYPGLDDDTLQGFDVHACFELTDTQVSTPAIRQLLVIYGPMLSRPSQSVTCDASWVYYLSRLVVGCRCSCPQRR